MFKLQSSWFCFFIPRYAEVPVDRAEEGRPESCGCSAAATHQESSSDEGVPALHLLPV